MDDANRTGSMAKWQRRLMRLMLPFGLLWLAFGILDLLALAQSADPRPGLAVQGIFALAGGTIFIANWWVSRREVR